MHFAYPPRKSSNPPPYMRASKFNLPIPALRRGRTKLIALAGLAFITLIYLLTRSGGRQGQYKAHKPSGKPPVVLVTVFDESKFPREYTDLIKENRRQYAAKHGAFPTAVVERIRKGASMQFGQGTDLMA